MSRKKISVRGVETDAVKLLHELRQVEQRMTGAILSDAIYTYWEQNYAQS